MADKDWAAWVVLMEEGYFCRRCGATQPPTVPNSLPGFLAEAQAFIRKYEKCREKHGG